MNKQRSVRHLIALAIRGAILGTQQDAMEDKVTSKGKFLGPEALRRLQTDMSDPQETFSKKDSLRSVARTLVALVKYCSDHNWGTIPVGKEIEAAIDLAAEIEGGATEPPFYECPTCGADLAAGPHKPDCSH